MVRHRLRGTGDCHVRIADGLDLLDPVPPGERVEAAEEVVEERDDALRIGPSGPRREARDVGEQDRRFRVRLGDPLLTVLEPGRDRGRDRVREQVIRARFRRATAVSV